MINVGVVGLGKMGLSHLSMLRPHPDVTVTGVCDPTRYVVDILGKYTGVPTFTDYERMLAEADLDAVVIATPSRLHAPMVEAALERGLHVFCEKPLFLNPMDGQRLTRLAEHRGLVTQVGYHNRFVASFAEAKRLIDLGAVGNPTFALAEAYGPVVLKTQGRSWRSRNTEGGGSLYDYAAHPLDLLTWYLGPADSVGGSRLGQVFSRETDDTVAASLGFGSTSALLSINWSDESQRKMTTKITIWGTHGRLYVDRQEIQVYRRAGAPPVEGYDPGWTVRYTTDLTPAPWFYVRGEEYSAQLDAFIDRVTHRRTEGINTFATASVTDQVIAMIARNAAETSALAEAPATPPALVPTDPTPSEPGRVNVRAFLSRVRSGAREVRVRMLNSRRTRKNWRDAA